MSVKKAEYIWFNGSCVPWQDAKVHVMSHALHYGSSVFEGIRVYKTPQGSAIFRLPEHVQRLFDSAKIYRMPIPFSQMDIMNACKNIVLENKLTEGAYIRPLIFMGDVGAGVKPPVGSIAEVMVAAFPWGAYLGEGSLEQGVKAQVSSWQRLAPNTMPTAAKAGGHYLSSQLIAEEARRHGYDEGIALDIQGQLSEGSGENIFVVKGGILYTPPATAAILPGITRDTVFQLAESLGYKVVEQALPRESLYLADEVMMTGTAAEIVPVCHIDGLEVGTGKPGPITRHMQKAFFGLFNGETVDQWGWLDAIEPQHLDAEPVS